MKVTISLTPRKKYCGLFSSGVFFLLGFYVLFAEKIIDMSAVLKALWLAGLGALAAGIIGYLVGKIIESPAKSFESFEGDMSSTDSDLIIDDVMIDDLKNINNSES